MHIIDRINLLMNERNLKNKDIADFLKLRAQVVTDWRAGRSRSYEKYLPQIASFFDVTMEYLIGETEKNGTAHPDDALSHVDLSEKHMLEKYRTLSDKGKKKAVEYIDDLAFNPDNVDDNFQYMLATAAFDGRYTTEKIPYSLKEVKSILESDDIEGEDF